MDIRTPTNASRNPVQSRKDEYAVSVVDDVRLRDLEFTDLYISETGKIQIRGIHNTTGPLEDVPDNIISDLDELQLAVMAEAQKLQKKEFFLDYDSVRYRVARINSLGGVWYTLRKSKTVIPRLKELGGFLPGMVEVLSYLGSRNGLILIAGATGQGKTTTACSLLREYLLGFGDVAVTIEDPPELMLDGEHGNFGRCFQLMLEEGQTFASALVDSLRYTPRYIFLGELRKPEDASMALRAAISGHLVITTIHAGDVEEALNAMIKLAGGADGSSVEYARDQLAVGLAAVIHQRRIKNPNGKNTLQLQTLFTGKDKGLKTMIREGQINQIGTAIEQQKSKMAKKETPVDIK